jgi:hypothetical protein
MLWSVALAVVMKVKLLEEVGAFEGINASHTNCLIYRNYKMDAWVSWENGLDGLGIH